MSETYAEALTETAPRFPDRYGRRVRIGIYHPEWHHRHYQPARDLYQQQPADGSEPAESLWLNGVDIVDMLDYGYWTFTPNIATTMGHLLTEPESARTYECSRTYRFHATEQNQCRQRLADAWQFRQRQSCFAER